MEYVMNCFLFNDILAFNRLIYVLICISLCSYAFSMPFSATSCGFLNSIITVTKHAWQVFKKVRHTLHINPYLFVFFDDFPVKIYRQMQFVHVDIFIFSIDTSHFWMKLSIGAIKVFPPQ
jgi:hypothetical protein